MASITIPSAAKLAFLISAPIIVLLLIASTASAASPASYGNVLISGDLLAAGSSLVRDKYNFTMQQNCNLELFEGEVLIWSSHTDGRGTKCYLILQKNGELLINDATSGNTVWRSETTGEYGHYALVLQPNRNVVVYGSPLWSTGTYVAPV